ncbi:MAG: MauE/DoxX family redox-associated membrane protein [Dehalococcoidales bacterium]
MGIRRYKHWIGVWACLFLGLIFVAAGLGKALHRAEAFMFFPDFLPPALAKVIFVWLPAIELTVGLLLITGIAAKFVATFSLMPIAGFMANNSLLLSLGLGYEPCECFGIAETLTQAKLSIIGALYLDIVMLALVLVILFCYQRNFFNIYPWFISQR